MKWLLGSGKEQIHSNIGDSSLSGSPISRHKSNNYSDDSDESFWIFVSMMIG